MSVFLKYKKESKSAFGGKFHSYSQLEVNEILFFCLFYDFSEVCSTWKDGCIAFSSEHIQISKYYLDGPDSKPYQKCKVSYVTHFGYFLLS